MLLCLHLGHLLRRDLHRIIHRELLLKEIQLILQDHLSRVSLMYCLVWKLRSMMRLVS